MTTESIEIVDAKEEDLGQIFDFVKQLAIFEKEPESVTTDIEEYKKCFKQGVFDAILAKKEGKAVGMALFYTTFSTWKGKMMYLEDFIVEEPYRKLGIGEMLFDRFIAISKEREAKLAKWQVLDWNTIALNFYAKKDAIIEKNWWNGKIIF